MAVKVGINGFGRIGRNLLRSAINNPEIEFVAVNDITDAKTLAHLLKYDSIIGTFDAKVEVGDNALIVNGRTVKVFSEPNVSKINWGSVGAEIVVESTGRFVDKPNCSLHLHDGVKKVIISAPAKDEDITLVLGVNDAAYDAANHHVISNASCTTNCLAPVAKVVHEKFNILRGSMTTIHSYTNDQKILDLPHKDLRRARAAAMSMIPTTTGAAKAIGLVIPQLKGKLDGIAIRVPTPNVSVVDLVVSVEKAVTKEEVNQALKEAANTSLKNVLEFCEEELVSIDFRGNAHSSILDAGYTKVVDGTLVHLMAWYDNEWGYSCRVRDLINFLVDKGL
ncbi:MAG: type I glyceraldehyde-3-phosphate dehydrogenase [Acidobacteria bacterium]|nr:type I glyceraldehyde-3-phosphate dehydrogenase [Acidobacteriota bacterium]